MNFIEYQKLLADGLAIGIDPSLQVSNFNGACAVNGFVALRLTSVSPQYERATEIEILLGVDPGSAYLITTKNSPFLYSQASHLWTAAYLAEQLVAGVIAEVNQGSQVSFQFENDYVAIKSLTFDLYVERYRQSSVVWGSFTHPAEQNSALINFQRNTPISAKDDLKLPTPEHWEIALRSASQSSALDRYLNLYHLLELSFDYDLVEQIKRLDKDLKGVGKLLSSHNNSEFEKLKKLLLRYCVDISFLAASLNAVFSKDEHRPVLWEMLFDYSKDSNPYKDKRAEFITLATTGFTQSIFIANKFEWKLDRLVHLAGYIIYRFRCSIAHASIGEFIIGNSEEKFVAEVAEPLIKSILFSVYSNSDPA